MDLRNDLREAIVKEFSYLKIEVKPEADFEKLMLDFSTLQKKVIIPRPRRVGLSAVLKSKLESHSKRDIVQLLKSRFETGQDVNQFQSDKLFQLQFHDDMLYDWNIYHLHLSNENYKDKPYFKKRTNSLLFVFVDHDISYFLDVDNHKVFDEKKWLEIIHDNWPTALAKYEADDVIDLSHNLSTEERKSSREFHLNEAMIKIRDKIYFTPGSGKTTSGHSIESVKQMIATKKWISLLEDQFKENKNVIIEYYGNLLSIPPDKVLFQLKITEGGMVIKEASSNTIILPYRFPFKIEEIKNSLKSI